MSPRREACVIGHPVAHSRSPLIHGHWLALYGIDGVYRKAAVAPEDLAAFVASMPDRGTVGANVTVPHKEAMVSLCARLTPAAARVGSVNTIWFDGDTLCGDTTDGQGFIAALDQDAPGWDAAKTETAVVIGAGGAARAIVDALKRHGISDVVVASRTSSRSERLAQDLDCRWARPDTLSDALPTTGLLVNTTPAGMAGQPALDFDLSGLPAHAVVDDIVYVPRETPLLLAARARGLRTVGGLGMLLHQAVPGFAHWFGVRPEVTPALRALVEADIAG